MIHSIDISMHVIYSEKFCQREFFKRNLQEFIIVYASYWLSNHIKKNSEQRVFFSENKMAIQAFGVLSIYTAS